MDNTTAYAAIGRRKESVARVRLTPGKGKFTINGRPLDKYFPKEKERLIIKQPLQLTNYAGKFDVLAILRGGGFAGQAGALRHGISRALLLVDQANREALKKEGFLTRDPRAKERKKYGLKGARKRFQWTKR